MWEKLKKQLEKIQNSDEATKKRWLIGASTLTMILVIGLWLIFFNFTIKPISETATQESSFWQIFKTGLNVVIDSIKESVKNFVSKITSERTITVEP